MRAGIYMGWVGFGNLGDEAMYALCKERFPFVHWSTLSEMVYTTNVTQFVRRATKDYRYIGRALRDELLHQPRMRNFATKGVHKIVRYVGGEVGLLGGGTLINRNAQVLDSYLDVRTRTRCSVPIFGTGVASPDFWSSKPGWKDRRKDWVAALADLPTVGVRGPRSMELLNDADAKNVVVCGDPAIAYYSESSSANSLELTNEPMRIAINTGECSGNLWGSPDGLEESLIGFVRWLKDENHQIELIPVSVNDTQACITLARRCNLEQRTINPPLTSHTTFMQKIKAFDLVIALKLHAAILSAAANVPCVVLAYEPKCLDFAASVEWEEFSIRTDRLSATRLIELVSSLIAHLPAARATLRVNASRLSQRFREYCQLIEPIISGKAC